MWRLSGAVFFISCLHVGYPGYSAIIFLKLFMSLEEEVMDIKCRKRGFSDFP